MDLKQIAAPREIMLAGFVMVALVFLFGRTFCAPKSKEIDTFKSQVKTLATEKEALVRFIEAVAANPPKPMVSEEDNPDPKTEVILGKRKPEVADVPSLMARVTEPDFLGGVQLDSFKFLDSAEEQGLIRSSFVIEAKGSFSAVASLVEKVEKMPALITADELSLDQEEGKAGEVTLKLEGTIYQAVGNSGPVDKTP